MPPVAQLPASPWYHRALVLMFGLGNRKVLKYSAIETSLPIDVEDTVTCFCRSVCRVCPANVTMPTSSIFVYVLDDDVDALRCSCGVPLVPGRGTTQSVSTISPGTRLEKMFARDAHGVVFAIEIGSWVTHGSVAVKMVICI